MTERLSLCDAQTALTPIEQLVLEQLPHPAHEIVDDPQCELQDGHEGPHAALAQESGTDDTWWLLWAPDGVKLAVRGEELKRRLHRLPSCTAVSPEDADEECRLPATHPGAHSFAMESSGPRTPSAECRKKIAAALREDIDAGERAYYDEIEAQLTAPGTPLPLLTESEALALAMMLRL
ncbi:hypothetical protein [Streptomyces sp. WM6378]|uniref:hypothetical protein n=1 Tax=Streptomyces sp. WM6378 TaxID=1415557 RepID=UPI00131B5872|nr:hypothetical protein [Streptomyces sp. WM6378]